MADAQQVALGVFFVFALAGLAIVGIPLISAQAPVAGNAMLSTATAPAPRTPTVPTPPTLPLSTIQEFINTYYTGAAGKFSISIESADGRTIDFLVRDRACREVEKVDKNGKKYMSCEALTCQGVCYYYVPMRQCTCAQRAIV